MAATKKTYLIKGWIFLSLWLVLIVAGIISKRIYGHPDWMVFFHLPAAVFLVLAWYQLSTPIRSKYQQELRRRSSSNISGCSR